MDNDGIEAVHAVLKQINIAVACWRIVAELNSTTTNKNIIYAVYTHTHIILNKMMYSLL